MPRIIRIMALLLITAASVSAQSRQGVVRISPFTGSGIPASELTTLERLVASHVAELRLFRVIDDLGRELALGETELALSLGQQPQALMPLAADFILSGHLGRIGDLYVFTLDNTRVSSGEKFSVSDTGNSINDIVLRTRSLTRTLFGRADEGQAPMALAGVPEPGRIMAGNEGGGQSSLAQAHSADSPAAQDSKGSQGANFLEKPNLAQVAGTWRGDRGLETVRLFPNGTGMAVLSGGGTMRLRVSLDGSMVIVTQDQVNDPAMYRSPGINFDIASKIASLARPMKWLFRLSPDEQALTGLKESVLVSGSSTSLTVDNDYVREASWTRISR